MARIGWLYLLVVMLETRRCLGQSLSRQKKVTMSSQFEGWVGSRAVDGNYNRKADDCGCCAATNIEGNLTDPWMEIDLGETTEFNRIVVYGQNSGNHERQNLIGLSIQLDDSEKSIASIEDIGQDYVNFQHFDLGQIYSANRVKLVLKGSNKVLVLCEVDVFNDLRKVRVISHRKPAVISSQYYGWVPSRAVDGNYRTKAELCECCTATERQDNPWLRVDLGFEHRVSRVVIYGRTDGQYGGQTFAGMIIELDSTVVHTIPTSSNWIDFYQYPLATVRLASNVTLTLVGSNKQLVVCELLVYGDCKQSFYSDSCSMQCHCEGEPCPTTSGICPSGRCEPGYQTETCNEPCDTGKYGDDCSMTCGNCKEGQICDHVTGYCDECKPGYVLTDPLCKTRCSDGRYGYKCSGTCGKCRNSETCNFITGFCTQCEDGYKFSDLLCTTVCSGGTYGTNCIDTCGSCRDGEICDKVNGHCTECKDGYIETDKTCKTRCVPGSYGRNCAMTCGSCKDDVPCNHANGSCKECLNGTFVFNDRLCNTECEPHTHGYNCTDNCGNCRANTPCNRANGMCTACEDGYESDDRLCNTVCGWGTYGFNCDNACGNCLDNVTCDRVNGSCSECSQGYFGMLCAEPLLQAPDGDDGSNTVVIIGAIIPVVLIIAIVAVVVLVVIKKRRPYKQHQDRPTAELGRIYENTEALDNVVAIGNEDKEPSVSVEEINDHDYYVFSKNDPGIPIHQLWDYIATNKGEGFLNEYETLEEGLLHLHNDALANRKKNRYRKMFPYDHSRVHLKVERPGESEFINASHIDGFERKLKFIASQGPIDVMVVDFWRMVWQQNTTKIVMLTNLVENGNNKCMQYWPNEETEAYERISIKMVKEYKESDYVIRTLDIAQDDEPPRRVKQYHYNAWPDKAVPDSTWSLIQFWREVFRDKDKSPVVVHCSAGVGRTGTFIAMDNLYHQAITTGRVTPLEIVERLRDQRVKMVQTSEQYEFLHEAVADTLLFGTHYIWQSQYAGYYDFMMKKDQAIGGKTRLAHQFKLVKKSLKGKPLLSNGDENKANAKECDEYKPKGSKKAETEKQGPKFLPSLGGSESFILTTIPDTNTLTACLRLVDEHNVRAVITIMDVAQLGYSIWGSNNIQICEKYKPVLDSNKTEGFVTERTITYFKQTKTNTSKQNAKVKQMELKLSMSTDPAKQAESVSRVFDVITDWHPYISTKRTSYDSVSNQYKFIHDILLHLLKEMDPLYSEADAAEAALNDENIYQNA